jgi:hypothetical protein
MSRGVSRAIRVAVVVAAALAAGGDGTGLSRQAALAGTRAQSQGVTSLRVQNATPAEAYAALGGQTRVAFDFDPSWPPPADVRLSARVIQEPFWVALAAINGPAGMHVDHVQRQPAPCVRIVPTRDQPGRRSYVSCVDGPFLGELTSLPRSAEAGQGLKPGATAPQLFLRLYAEPAMRALLCYGIQVDELIDDSGRALEHRGFGHSPLPFERGAAGVLFRLSPRPDPLRIARMKLSATVLAAVRSEVAEVEGLSAGNPRPADVAGFRVETSGVPGQAGRPPLLKINLTRTAANGPDWLKPASRLRLLEPVVLDAAGRRVPARMQALNWSGRSGSILLDVDPPPAAAPGQAPAFGAPHRLLMEIPTDVAEYDVRLEFNEVPLR